ncbi:uncharacterized protein GLRG_06991 [Colletotrichum graminicola M1.001]|uniref:Uncharacterized protein n=1 Tax=Colletotrichum graminicola (strain M1.001 / M2 / FGSC 10212) TaxID=645133 RepID=E3QLV9_COLGM|nr:uncharacterized protein GLRG_06991 [Colletotrichum graminicola M1.001]EFQ31847.1 hypothetical protein GLRG_06991 [Colletotrichum graminicola M1.001]
MDGYAAYSKATTLASPERPLLLRVCWAVAAGDEPTELDERTFHGAVEPCLKITTGGIFPKVQGAISCWRSESSTG